MEGVRKGGAADLGLKVSNVAIWPSRAKLMRVDEMKERRHLIEMIHHSY